MKRKIKLLFSAFIIAAATFCLAFGLAGCSDKKGGDSGSTDNGGETRPASEGLEFSSGDERSYYVSGIGSCTDTEIVIPSKYQDLPVTGIGCFAFNNCIELTSITIPDSVTSVDAVGFYGCVGLETITVAEGNPKFRSENNCLLTKDGKTLVLGCKSSVIPNSVTSIDGSAFSGCSVLTSITIPDNVTNIGDGTFNGCSGLTSITIPGSVTSIGIEAFRGCSGLTSITIPDSVTSIKGGTFENCSGLTSIAIPDSVTSVASAFQGCSGIIQTENGVEYVDNWVVGCDESVTEVEIRNGTRGIGLDVFNGCSGLTSVTIPDSVKHICDYAFFRCSGLTSINIPDSVISVGQRAFQGCSGIIQTENGVGYVDKWVISCNWSITTVELRSGTKGIGACAFFHCPKLTSINVPDSVKSIGEGAFEASSISSITIGNGVTNIDDYAFHYCSALTSINFSGTKEQWLAIEKGTDWDSETGNYTVHCADGDIAKGA